MPRRRLGFLRQASKKKKNWMVLIKVSTPFRTGSLDMLSLIISFHIKSLELSLHLKKKGIFLGAR